MSLTAEFLESVQILRQVSDKDQGIKLTLDYPGFPTLENVLAKIAPLPEHGLFLGVASDGLPLLLNLNDPAPGQVLILGDDHTGKTDFLQGVARAVSLTHHPRFVRFAVVTPCIEEWVGWNDYPHCLGLCRPDDIALKDLLIDFTAGG
jgi:DNA segregation ATPase FtsK/SpoIIIE-like protein